ncbi:hypothetical protein SASPL_104549 [Salvia splendens]|uniref:Sialate O-acetylesterase domain-containing protein n=1 Tax=Salvia splendens TaxID=180675 RepID=A0A8X8YHQ2_SALSN|nr:hypothetical protein SASPL_104549 [Salvia splendens]
MASSHRRRAARDALRQRGEGGRGGDRAGALRHWRHRDQGMGVGEHLYENMVKRTKAAVSGGEIAALLWYQGESDTTSQEEVNAYKHKMEELIHNVRTDLNLPNLPVVQVALASGYEKKYVDEIRAIQLGMDLPNVDGKGLQLKEDNLHLTTEAQVQLGHSLAQAYLTNFLTEKAHILLDY